jgi:hypothetical protein
MERLNRKEAPSFDAWLAERERQQKVEDVIDGLVMISIGGLLASFFAVAWILERTL